MQQGSHGRFIGRRERAERGTEEGTETSPWYKSDRRETKMREREREREEERKRDGR